MALEELMFRGVDSGFSLAVIPEASSRSPAFSPAGRGISATKLQTACTTLESRNSKLASTPHAIIFYSQLFNARRAVSISVLSASMSAFAPAKSA